MQLKQYFHVIHTRQRGMTDLTGITTDFVKEAVINTGICQIFLAHTSASLILCENADPDVQMDLEAFMTRLIPDGDKLFKHVAEGADDMPAHIRTVLTQNSLTFPICKGELALGIWQGIYLWEHRQAAHKRNLTVTIWGL
ncbi:secondary thiamine-phosphate synthase enzyme YjbQ [soil metagenome]